MKRYVILTIFSFIFSFIYFSFVYVLFGFLTPNFLLIIPIAIMYKGKKDSAYFTAFALGIFTDLLTGYYLGATSLFLIIATGIFYHLISRISYMNIVTALTVFFGCLIYDQFVQNFIYGETFLLGYSLVQAFISAIFVFVALNILNLLPNSLLDESTHANK